MARGKKVPKMAGGDACVEDAVRGHDYGTARHAVAVKLAHMFDATDSARDAKALSLSIMPLLDACEGAERAAGAPDGAPLDEILAEAERVLDGNG